MDKQPHIHWSKKLEFKLIVTFLLSMLIFFGFAGSIIYNEASNYLEKRELNKVAITNQVIVEEVLNQTVNASSLAHSLASIASVLPLNDELFKSSLKQVLALAPKPQFIAGGGVWPEPFAFNADVKRNSYFWGKDKTGQLHFYNDYNHESGNGYHNEAWYVPSTFLQQGEKIWSGSYVDPYSLEPMVTVSVPIYKNDTLFGLSTVDMNLSGIDRIIRDTWSKQLNGYSFLMDLNGKLITKIKGINSTYNYPKLSELVKSHPDFETILNNADEVTKSSLNALAEDAVDVELQRQLTQNSYQISEQQAKLIAAVIKQPHHDGAYQQRVIKLPSAPLFNEPSFVVITESPETYWKVINVFPESAILNNVKQSLTRLFLPLVLVTLVLIIVFYFVVHIFYIRKVTDITKQLIDSDLSEDDSLIHTSDKGELGLITRLINDHIHKLRVLTNQLSESKQALELRIKISQSLQHPIELKYLLKDVLSTICKSRSLDLKQSAAIIFFKHSGKISEVFIEYGEFNINELSGYTFKKASGVTIVDDKYLIPLKLDHTAGVIVLYAKNEISENNRQYDLDTLTYIGNMINLAMSNEMARIDLIEEKAKAEQANKAKSDFLASMSHELRTPLNAILGFSQLLKRGTKNTLSDQQSQQLHFIIDGGKHLLKLINQVLELSAIEAGKIKLDIQDVSIQQSVNRTVDLTASLINKNNVSLHIDTDIDLAIRADITKLDQALINLVTNAIKYNRPNGEVHIKWHKLNHDFVQIAISDTGIGIPEDKFAAVFDPFNRLGKEASNIEGTGIGLSVTKDLIELMGGQLYFDSVVDKGTTFYIDIPVALEMLDLDFPEVNKRRPDEVNNMFVTDETKILYVEDIPTNQALMKSFFQQWNQTIDLDIADSAEKARQILVDEYYDLILMDLNLPGESGIDLTRSLKSNPKFSKVPIIAVTARAMREDISAVENLFDAYITKPVNFIELTQALEKHLHINL